MTPLPPPNPEFPDVPLGGVTELRTHGVSDTPVTSMLHHPHPVQVAGMGAAGFYRRGDDGLTTQFDPVPPGRNLEAYSWGGLTSGSASRAFWLLLAPFTLANVASWAHPVRPRPKYWPIGLMSGLIRVFALSLTVTFMLATLTVGVDLIAWQCAGDASGCGDKHFFAHPLVQHYAGRPGARVAIGALLAVAVLVVLVKLSKSTGALYEEYAEKHDADDGVQVDLDDPSGAADLANPRFWAGGPPFKRLRSLHVCAALATIAGVVGYAARESAALAWVAFALVAICALVLFSPWSGRRSALLRNEPPPAPACFAMVNAQWAGVALLAFSLWYAWNGSGPHAANATPPGLNLLISRVFAAQLVLLALYLGAAVLAKAMSPSTDAQTLLGHTLFRSFGGPVLAALSLGFAGAYASGVVVRVADYLGTPCGNDGSCPPGGIRVASTYYVASPVAVAALGAAIVVGAGVLLWLVLHRRPCCVETVAAEYGEPADSDRARAIGKAQASASLTDRADMFVGLFLVLAIAGTVWLRSVSHQHVVVTTAGTWLVAAFAGLLVAQGRSAYKSDGKRRTIGIIWDLGTFWPRAAHPFAPPCYCERVVPEFTTRVDRITKAGGTVVISAHSQGTIIAAAAVHRLGPDRCRNVALVTYGSPLERLYARLFPHFFGLAELRKVESNVGGCWRNLYRRTDPIGGPVFTLDKAAWTCGQTPTPTTDPVDIRLRDPEWAVPVGEVQELSPRAHSDYFHDAMFPVTVTAMADCVQAR